MSRIHSYVITTDNGGAPCTNNNLLTLGICKPKIREHAEVGDYIVGLVGKNLKKKCKRLENTPCILYMAKITDKVTISEYYKKYKERDDCIYNEKLELIPNLFPLIHIFFNHIRVNAFE